MTIIDGRNSYAVPANLTEEQFNALSPECIESYSVAWNAPITAHVYLIDNHYVVASHRPGMLILCGAYKSKRGVNCWLDRVYEHRSRIDKETGNNLE